MDIEIKISDDGFQAKHRQIGYIVYWSRALSQIDILDVYTFNL